MMLIKSFFRKKTIRNYFVIFFLIFASIFSCLVVRKVYTDKYNELNKQSFIAVKDPAMDIKDIKNDNIKDIVEGIEINGTIYRIDNSLKDNETIAPRELRWFPKGEVNVVGEKHTIQNAGLDLDIVEVSYDIGYFLVNENTYQKLIDSEAVKAYVISLKNYLISNETEQQIYDEFADNTPFIYYRNNNPSPKDYVGRISSLNFFMTICAILFGIVFIITFINIIIDEQKTNKLYHVIGYNKSQIFSIFLKKIICLLGLPLVLAIIVACIVGIILHFM